MNYKMTDTMDPKFSHAARFNNYQNGRGKSASFENTSTGAALTKKSFKNHLLASCSDYDLARLMPHFESVILASGEEIRTHDNGYVYFPENAVVSHLYMLEDGNTVEVAMIGGEGATGLCSLFGSDKAAHYVRVIAEGTAIRIKAEVLQKEFTYNRHLQHLLLDYINSHITQISQKTVCKSFHVIENRFCTWLLMLHDRAKRNQFLITQEQISLFIGVYRPTVTLIARALKENGLIDYKRGKISIVDRFGLERKACECYTPIVDF